MNNTALTAIRTADSITIYMNGEEKCSFGADTKRYQNTVAVSALQATEDGLDTKAGDLWDYTFHSSAQAAAKRKVPSYIICDAKVVTAKVVEA